jgi:hypothetical protein
MRELRGGAIIPLNIRTLRPAGRERKRHLPGGPGGGGPEHRCLLSRRKVCTLPMAENGAAVALRHSRLPRLIGLDPYLRTWQQLTAGKRAPPTPAAGRTSEGKQAAHAYPSAAAQRRVQASISTAKESTPPSMNQPPGLPSPHFPLPVRSRSFTGPGLTVWV